MPPAPRTFYVITTRGDVGPYTRAELREQLQSGAVRSGDQVRNAFGRPLGTVAEAMSDASSSRTPAHAGPPVADPPAPPTPRRSPAPLIIGVTAAVLIAAIVLVSILSRPTAPVAPPAPPPAVETPAPAAPIPSPQADAPAAALPAEAATPRAAAPPQDGALPDGWSFLDLGNARPKGAAKFAGGLWTIEGGGADVWFKRDECGFTHREAKGDFSAIVRVVSTQDTDVWDKSGIMVRSSVDESAPMAFLFVTHGGTVRFTLRKKQKGDAESIGTASAALPVWLQLTRRGNTFGGYWSTDGTTWTGVGSKIDLANVAATARLGLAVCSHNRSTTNRAVFSDLSVTAPR
jgi:regulation of enolase protein 1 (concanavalin A-like superfamily)